MKLRIKHLILNLENSLTLDIVVTDCAIYIHNFSSALWYDSTEKILSPMTRNCRHTFLSRCVISTRVSQVKIKILCKGILHVPRV